MVDYQQKIEALKMVPSISINEMEDDVGGICYILVNMSFLFGPSSEVYYTGLKEAISGSYTHLYTSTYSMCRRIELEKKRSKWL